MRTNDRTLQQLDWPQLCAHVADRCAGDPARERWSAPALSAGPAEVRERLRRVAEAMEVLETSGPPPFGGYYDLRPHVERLRRAAALGPEELVQAAATLSCIRHVRSFLVGRREVAPELGSLASALPALGDLADTIRESFDDAGQLTDNASSELGSLRRRVASLRESVAGRMDQLVRDLDQRGLLQDSYFTLRQERYVVPLRSGARGHLQCIVHDVSGSGQTLFVEPQEMVEPNNRLRIAQLELAEEERRVLVRLSEWLREELVAVELGLEVLAEVDEIFAAARLGHDLNAQVVEVSARETVLVRARHPLLVLQGKDVVANDVELRSPGRTLVISGPNTGGKTVTLKMVGLFALMLRAGLPLPVDQGSAMPLFSSVHADIGDDQSLARSLSTFSAHLTNLSGFLGGVSADSLVLLDELVVGTDPREGEALAVAVLRWLADSGAWTVVTTHYEGLKTLALADERFANAAVGFDANNLQPTYRLRMGAPGRSSPIEIAAHLGLPDGIVASARQHLAGEGVQVEDALRELEQLRLEVERERGTLRQERETAQRAAAEAERARSRYDERRRALAADAGDETLQALAAARAELRGLVRELQRGPAGHRQVRKAQQRLEAVEGRVADRARQARLGTHPEAGLPLSSDGSALKPGVEVLVAARGLTGVVESVDPARDQVALRVGALRLVVPSSELRLTAPGKGRRSQGEHKRGGRARASGAARSTPRRPGRRRVAVPKDGDPGSEPLVSSGNNRLDLRGCRVDEALGRCDAFFDRALSRSEQYVFLIHGHGTGALKAAVREHIESSPYILRWRSGMRREGGDGVSIVWIDSM